MPQNSFAPVAGEAGDDVGGWRAALVRLFTAEEGRWILFVPVMFGAGIALWFLLPWVGQRQAAVLAGAGIALSGLLFSGRARRVICMGGLLLAAGLIAAEVRSLSVASPRLHHRLVTAGISGTVENIEHRSGGERVRITLMRDASDIDPAARVTISSPAEVPDFVRPGARIALPATLMPLNGPILPGGYGPLRRAWFDGIAATGRAMGPPRLLEPAGERPGGAAFAEQRRRLAEHVQTSIGGDAGAVAVALVIGEQGQVPMELVDAMRISSLVHLLTVSGFHVAVVVGGVMLLSRWLLTLWPWLALRILPAKIAAIIAGCAGTAYVLLAGADVPAVRAGIIAWIVVLAILMGRDPFSLRLLAFAALLILAVRPESLLNPSFQLSFAAVTSLIVFANSRLGQLLYRRTPDESRWQKLGRYLALLVLTGIVVEIVLLPIVLSLFGRSGVYGVLANMAAIPLTSFVIMPLLGLFLLFSLFGMGWLAAPLLGWSIDRLNDIALHVSAWPGAAVSVPFVPMHAYALGVLGALLFGLFCGRLRLLGIPLLAAGIGMSIWWPRPDLLIPADGRQVAAVVDGGMYTLRGHRGGFVVRTWSEAMAAPPAGRFADIDGARCDNNVCTLSLGEKRPLHLLAGDLPQNADCSAADVVVAPYGLPESCAPRWLKLDARTLVRTGAVAIHADRRRFDSVAAHAGDQPWSPATTPGEQITLLGRSRWIGVLAE